MSEPRDDVLIDEVLDGNREAFRPLVERYQRPFLLYATRMVSNRAEAEDIVQDALVTAYEKLAECQHPERFAAWCFRIVRNRCHDHHRSPESRAAGPEPLAELPTDDEGPEVAVERRELRRALRGAVQSLSPLLREAFVLYHEERLTYPEMADRLDASESALKMRVKRAREALRAALSTHCGHL